MAINTDETLKPLVTGMAGACTLLDCGVDHLYDLIHKGEIDSYLEGTRRKVTIDSIERLIARRLAAKGAKLDRSQILEKRLAAKRIKARRSTEEGRAPA
jgi:excisionase family DNA binding protein